MANDAKVPQKLKVWVPVAIASIELIDKLWRVANKDQRVSSAGAKLLARVRLAAIAKNPSVRLARQLDAVAEYLREAKLPAERRVAWQKDVDRAREVLVLVRAMPARRRRQHLRELDAEVDTLFAAIVKEVGSPNTSDSSEAPINAH